jgi:hypothetical protein
MGMRQVMQAAAAGWLAVAALAGCREQPLLTDDETPPAQALSERVQVLSADTLVIDKTPVRLANAFAPEPIPQARCWAEAVASNQATDVVREIVRGARTVDVKAVGGFDEYHRPFSTVTLDGLDLGQTLYDRGLAARPGETRRRFEWCNPISQQDPGAPTLSSLMKY